MLMAKHILSTLCCAVFLLGAPQTSAAAEAIEIVENDFQNVTISISEESVLRVTGAAGQSLYVYNVTGVCVMSVKVDSSDKTISLNLPKGCYIVKVGKVVRKVSVR